MSVREAAERLRTTFEHPGPGALDGMAEAYSTDEGRFHNIRQITADMTTLSRAYLAEHPADDGEPADDQWIANLVGRSLEAMPTKRLMYRVAMFPSGMELGYCPPCGSLPPCLCVGVLVICTSPTRRQVRQLIELLRGTP